MPRRSERERGVSLFMNIRSLSDVLLLSVSCLASVALAQVGEDAGRRIAAQWRVDFGRARLHYEDAMERLQGEVLAALTAHEAQLGRQAIFDHDEVTRVRAERQDFILNGSWPHIARAENLRARAEAIRGQLLRAYEAARNGCVKAGLRDAAAELDVEWMQFGSEVDLVPFGENVVSGLPLACRTASMDMLAWTLDDVAEPHYRIDLQGRCTEDTGVLCIGLVAPDGDLRVVRADVTREPVRIMLSMRAGVLTVDVGVARVTREAAGESPGGRLLLWATTASFEVTSLRTKPIRRATEPGAATETPAESAAKPTIADSTKLEEARSSPAEQAAVDPFAVGTSWTGKWNETSCIVTVVTRGADTVSIDLARDNGSVFRVDCLCNGHNLKVRSIKHTTVPRGGRRRALSEVSGSGWVRGNEFSLEFDSRSRTRSKKESFEAVVTGRRRNRS